MVQNIQPSATTQDLHSIKADASKGLRRATQNERMLYLSARTKTNPLQSASDKLRGRRTAQHEEAMSAFQSIVRKVNDRALPA
ncbi:hypothetical protein [Variovorax sp. PBL-E5]|uniref:hypothetical protein n=1 Tax=Variovorax sp. PBL-E5 TaxID=434014 RepID=UPI001316D6F8|nr:hypothetical protein [Variovorax sp. PBL-E5]VTU25988.1 hypothetical protein E5CHR_02106 [Variovorax sp. PBL-E5]